MQDIDWKIGTNTSALIFDCDGTLADTMPVHFVAWSATMARYGLEFTEDRFYQLAGTPPFRIIGILATEQGKSVDARAVAAEKEALYLESLQEVQPIERVLNVAREYQGKLPMAVASGSTRDVVTRTLKHLGATELFELAVTSEDTELHKPNPDVFLKAAEMLGVTATKCHVFEDADGGIEAAKRAGMTYFDVRTVHQPRRHSRS